MKEDRIYSYFAIVGVSFSANMKALFYSKPQFDHRLEVPPNPVLSCLVLEKLSPDELLELPSPPLFQRLPLPFPSHQPAV